MVGYCMAKFGFCDVYLNWLLLVDGEVTIRNGGNKSEKIYTSDNNAINGIYRVYRDTVFSVFDWYEID